MKKISLFVIIFITCVFDFSPLVSATTTYTITDMGTLGASTVAYGINDSGVVVGYSYKSVGGDRHAFIWNGSMHDLGTLRSNNSGDSEGWDINASGHITGWSDMADNVWDHTILWDGSMHDLGSLGEIYKSYGYGINASDQIVGKAYYNTSRHRAYLWENDPGHTMINLGTLGGAQSSAQSINDSGQVVGWADFTNGDDRAFIWDATGGMTEIVNSLGGTSSSAFDINNSGQVVGWARNASNNLRAFIWDTTSGMLDLNINSGQARGVNDFGQVVGFVGGTGPFVWDSVNGVQYLNATLQAGLITNGTGWTLIEAYDINDSGQIVGYGQKEGEVGTRGFLLTPIGAEEQLIPEPISLLLLGFGVLGIGLFKKRITGEGYR